MSRCIRSPYFVSFHVFCPTYPRVVPVCVGVVTLAIAATMALTIFLCVGVRSYAVAVMCVVVVLLLIGQRSQHSRAGVALPSGNLILLTGPDRTPASSLPLA